MIFPKVSLSLEKAFWIIVNVLLCALVTVHSHQPPEEYNLDVKEMHDWGGGRRELPVPSGERTRTLLSILQHQDSPYSKDSPSQ